MGYRILEPADIPAYLNERGHWANPADIEVREVSDGNMNRVFLARSTDGTRSLAVKQALPWVRVAGPSWPMSPERADAEARAYEQVAKVAPDKIPAILGYDPEHYALVMEDMSDLEVLRTLLNEGASYGPHTSARIGEFVAQLTFATSDFGMASADRKALLAASVSPELCKITEDVVLAEPYIEHEHNHWHEDLDDLATEFRADARLRTEVADLRHTFMTSAQALLHGDLHTGSVMVGGRQGAPVVRVFDPEFSFVGPIGYDLGLYWANALVSEQRARALGLPDRPRRPTRPVLARVRDRVPQPVADPNRHVLRRRVPGPLPAQNLDGLGGLRGHGDHPQNHRLRPPDRPDNPPEPGTGLPQGPFDRPRTDRPQGRVDHPERCKGGSGELLGARGCI